MKFHAVFSRTIKIQGRIAIEAENYTDAVNKAKTANLFTNKPVEFLRDEGYWHYECVENMEADKDDIREIIAAQIMTSSEACEILKISRTALADLIAAKKLPALLKTTQGYLFLKEDVYQYLGNRKKRNKKSTLS